MSVRLCGCVIAIAALLSQVALAASERVELPGFSILLPRGEVTARSSQPLAGRYRVKIPQTQTLAAPYDALDPKRLHPAHREIAVSWINQIYSHDEWLAMMVRPVATSIPGARILHDEDLGGGRFLAATGSDRTRIGMAMAPCGERFSVFVVIALSLELADQLRAARLAIDSIVCSADAPARRLETVITLPADFSREADSESYSNPDGEVVVASYTGGSIRGKEEKFGKVFATMLSSTFNLDPGSVSLTPVTRLADGSPVHRLSGGGEFEGAYVAARDCPEQEITLIVIWVGPKPGVPLAVKRLSAVSCPAPALKPGDPGSSESGN